ncbi:MAG: undecaprenyl-phosphate glucose phosphotransferase [Muribaculaceae bacterium]|nr:undecaprenyl-phosphate glucose phosphotransferase [Muribaculaceae bacterium]
MFRTLSKGRFGKYLQNLMTVSDFIVLNIVFFVMQALSPDFITGRHRLIWLLVNIAFLPAIYWLGGIHRARAIPMHHVMFNSLRVIGLHALFFCSLLYFLEIESIQWRSMLLFYAVLFVVFPVWWSGSRMMVKQLRRRGYNFCRVVIVGTGTTAMRLYEQMNIDLGFGYRVIGFFDDNMPPNFPYRHLYRGSLDKLNDYIKENRVDEVFYTLSGNDEDALTLTLHAADANVAKFYYVPQISRYLSRGLNLRSVGSVPILSVRETPLTGVVNSVMKRVFDITFSTVVLIFSPIVFIPVAIAIKMSSPGPVFFKQKRTGYKGCEFTCLKFRTMRLNADDNTKQTERNDPRKTRVGEFLRKTSIDELPQFINVLLGDMSVVGPRPHMLRDTLDYSALIDRYMVRHVIRPGITGWAQVNGFRGATDELWKMEKRVEYDVWYSENWSLMLDIKIIIRTVINAFKGEKNAF